MKMIVIYDEHEPPLSHEEDMDLVLRCHQTATGKILKVEKPTNYKGSASTRSIAAYLHELILRRK